MRGDDVFKSINHDGGTKSWRKVRNYPIEIAVHDYIASTHAGPQVSFDALRAFVKARVIVYPDALRSIGLNRTYRRQQLEATPEEIGKRREEMDVYLTRLGRLSLKDIEELDDAETSNGE